MPAAPSRTMELHCSRGELARRGWNLHPNDDWRVSCRRLLWGDEKGMHVAEQGLRPDNVGQAQ